MIDWNSEKSLLVEMFFISITLHLRVLKSVIIIMFVSTMGLACNVKMGACCDKISDYYDLR